MKWKIIYYNEELQHWTENLPVEIRAYYARITERMEIYGPNLGLPHTRPMGEGLFEIRAQGKEGIARIFYCTVINQKIVMLHGFIKKTRKTPRNELKTANQRMKEVKNEIS